VPGSEVYTPALDLGHRYPLDEEEPCTLVAKWKSVLEEFHPSALTLAQNGDEKDQESVEIVPRNLKKL
jgi:hypothetical protein